MLLYLMIEFLCWVALVLCEHCCKFLSVTIDESCGFRDVHCIYGIE